MQNHTINLIFSYEKTYSNTCGISHSHKRNDCCSETCLCAKRWETDQRPSNRYLFEDISSSADGGLNAELIQNGSFEYNPMERDGWGPGTNWKMIRPGHALGNLEVKQQDPIHPNNPNYMRVYVERVRPFRDYSGWIGFGMQNDGFDGISVKKDADYDFSMFVRDVNKKGMKIRVALVQPQGWGKRPETSRG